MEHFPVITAGINSKKENLLVSESVLKEKKIDFEEIQRGGDFTAHEPGQLVIYAHIDLKKRNWGIDFFLKSFQDAVSDAVKDVSGVSLFCDPKRPGLYLSKNPDKKIVSIGVYFKSFFTSFGAAVNLNNSLEVFRNINPCGISAENMSSVCLETGERQDMRRTASAVRDRLIEKWEIGTDEGGSDGIKPD